MSTVPRGEVHDRVAARDRRPNVGVGPGVAPAELDLGKVVVKRRRHVATAKVEPFLDQLSADDLPRVARCAGHKNLHKL